MAKLSSFMYGMILSVGLFAILSVVLGQLFVNYAVPLTSGYNTTFAALANTTGVASIVEEQKAATLTEGSNAPKSLVGQAFDILGFWFERGFAALKGVGNSIGLFYTITDVSLNSLTQYLGFSIEPLRFMIGALIVVAITIGIILSTLVKREV